MGLKFKHFVRTLYLYTFSTLGLVLLVIGAVMLVNVCLKTYIFPVETYREYYYSDCDYDYGKYDYNLDEYVEYTEEEEAACEEEERVADSDARKRDLALGTSLVIVGVPLWIYHWMVIQRRRKED